MKKTKSMTPKQVQKKLNALCQGLGDAWMENYKEYELKSQIFYSFRGAFWSGFVWEKTPEGNNNWLTLAIIFEDMEKAELI